MRTDQFGDFFVSCFLYLYPSIMSTDEYRITVTLEETLFWQKYSFLMPFKHDGTGGLASSNQLSLHARAHTHVSRTKWARFIEAPESNVRKATRQFSDAGTQYPSSSLSATIFRWHLGKSFIEVQSISVARSFRGADQQRPAFESAHRRKAVWRCRGRTIGFIHIYMYM